MDEAEKKARHGRIRDKGDWISAFDRDLIRAAVGKLEVNFETCDDEMGFVGTVIQVDQHWIKFETQEGQSWFNKSVISRVKVLDHAAE